MIDRTVKIEKFTERLTESCYIPDLAKAFSNKNGGLNRVLRHAKPPTCITAIGTYSSITHLIHHRGTPAQIF